MEKMRSCTLFLKTIGGIKVLKDLRRKCFFIPGLNMMDRTVDPTILSVKCLLVYCCAFTSNNAKSYLTIQSILHTYQ